MLSKLVNYVQSFTSTKTGTEMPPSGWDFIEEFVKIHSEVDHSIKTSLEAELRDKISELPESEFHQLLGYVEDEMEFWERFRVQLQYRALDIDELKFGGTD